MSHPAEMLAQVVSDLDAVLSDTALAGLSDADRVRVLQVAGAVARRVDAVVVETLGSTNPTDLAHGAVSECAGAGAAHAVGRRAGCGAGGEGGRGGAAGVEPGVGGVVA
ncbi:hypothetical protein, partial [Microbacterium sp. SZ1]|uniref:hypothetical protein n=1 Tax=Microbacterium sp. SZ1 TaxID=1849736 RepID=UPI001C53F97A